MLRVRLTKTEHGNLPAFRYDVRGIRIVINGLSGDLVGAGVLGKIRVRRDRGTRVQPIRNAHADKVRQI
jgi:hypothetical protein